MKYRIPHNSAAILAEVREVTEAMRAKNPAAFAEARAVVRRRVRILAALGEFDDVVREPVGPDSDHLEHPEA